MIKKYFKIYQLQRPIDNIGSYYTEYVLQEIPGWIAVREFESKEDAEQQLEDSIYFGKEYVILELYRKE